MQRMCSGPEIIVDKKMTAASRPDRVEIRSVPDDGATHQRARKVAAPATVKKRHRYLIVSFLFLVIAPICVVLWYLYFVAVDQYSSSMSFSVRSEEFHNPLDALSTLGQMSTGTTSDAAILYEYIRSQKIVRAIDAQIDLRKLYSKPDFDPVFTIKNDASTEELVEHWHSMAQVTLDQGSGSIKINSFGFTAEDAQNINSVILTESQKLVDRLSEAARKDAIRYAESDLKEARARLKTARQELSQFRAESRLIDPTINVESQGGITAALQQQLAEAMVQHELLLSSTSAANDPRLKNSKNLIKAIRRRIEEERKNLTANIDSSLVSIVSKYEALIVDREFSEKAYVSASAAYDSALASAKRRTKYLAVHIEPTIADTALYPRRLIIIAVVSGLLFLLWSVFLMIIYSFRDRR